MHVKLTSHLMVVGAAGSPYSALNPTIFESTVPLYANLKDGPDQACVAGRDCKCWRDVLICS